MTIASLRIELPIHVISEANQREHWRVKAARVRQQKMIVSLILGGQKLPPLPATITLTRVGKRRLDDDNLAGAFKACRDSIARCYGTDDGSELYKWKYSQRTGKVYGVELEIEVR